MRTVDERKPDFVVRVPKVTISSNGGATLFNSANYRKSRWTHWGGCPGFDPEYPIVTEDTTNVAYEVYSRPIPFQGLCEGVTTTAEPSPDTALKAVLPGSEPPFEPQPNLPVPVIAEN